MNSTLEHPLNPELLKMLEAAGIDFGKIQQASKDQDIISEARYRTIKDQLVRINSPVQRDIIITNAIEEYLNTLPEYYANVSGITNALFQTPGRALWLHKLLLHEKSKNDALLSKVLTIEKIENPKNKGKVFRLFTLMELFDYDGNCLVTGRKKDPLNVVTYATARAIVRKGEHLLNGKYQMKQIIEAFCNEYGVTLTYKGAGANFNDYENAAIGIIKNRL